MIMVSHDFWVLLAMLIYFVVVVVIGFIYAKKSNQSTEAYFLGGRRLGPWLTALSAEASDMSGWLLMGLPGVAYFTGASDAMWTAIGLAIGTYLNWLFVSKRLRKYSEVANNSITLPDYFSNRFHDNKNILMTIAALIILLFFSIYVGSCFVTVGKLFSTLFGLDYATMMVLGALIVFLYTFVGGYLSVCTTDLIQGTLMVSALVIVFVGSVAQAGGIDNTVAFLQNIPGFLSGTQIANPILDENFSLVSTYLISFYFIFLLTQLQYMILRNHNLHCLLNILDFHIILFSAELSIQCPRNLFNRIKGNFFCLKCVHMLCIHLLDQECCNNLLQSNRILRGLD